ncbi:MAG: hypothetical protein J6R18_04780 [Kiritimatiellae bacterium]|nr:hypothetical protein [Kiritimatiellia bacterium]
MAFNPRISRSGQAMTEFVVAILAIVLIIGATVEFLPVILDNIGLLKNVREEAGTRAISAESGIISADRSSEFALNLPVLLGKGESFEGKFTEKVHVPAGNLSLFQNVRIPVIAGMAETVRYSNRDGTSEFVSGLLAMNTEQALARVKGALTGAGWTAHEIQAYDAVVFSSGDPESPSAVAAAGVCLAEDNISSCVTIIARTAGSN